MNEPRQAPRLTPSRGLRRAAALAGTTAVFIVTAYAASELAPAPAEAVAAEAAAWRTLTPPADAVAAADAFLDALDAKQREKVALDYASDKKPNWSNFPASFTPRNGVKLGDLTKDQRAKAMAVVAAVLSKAGYQKVLDIMEGDQRLASGESGKGGGKGGNKGVGAMFGADLYYLAVFGKPAEAKPWMVQFGGHHLGVNVTVVGKNFILTPTHTGAQPAVFKRDGQDVRPLGAEADAAFKLMGALDAKQRAQAVVGERSQDLQLGPGRDGKTVEPKGVKGAALTAEQQALLLDVVGAWVNIAEPEAAAARLAEIKETVGETYFAWSGPTAPGSAAYFRVQGPTVVIEYAPQGGTGHIHTVIRNPKDDYGVSAAKK